MCTPWAKPRDRCHPERMRACFEHCRRVEMGPQSVSCSYAHLERMKITEERDRKGSVTQRRDRSVSGASEPDTECGSGFPSAPQNVASLSADESTRRRIEPAGSPLGTLRERGSVDEQKED